MSKSGTKSILRVLCFATSGVRQKVGVRALFAVPSQNGPCTGGWGSRQPAPSLWDAASSNSGDGGQPFWTRDGDHQHGRGGHRWFDRRVRCKGGEGRSSGQKGTAPSSRAEKLNPPHQNRSRQLSKKLTMNRSASCFAPAFFFSVLGVFGQQ